MSTYTHSVYSLFVLQCRALGNERRVYILTLLRSRAYTIEELTELLGIRQPSVTRHVLILQRAGFVQGKRRGRHVYFSLTPKARQCAWIWECYRTGVLAN